MRLDLQNSTTTSWTFAAAWPVSMETVTSISLDSFSTEKDGDSGVPKEKDGHKNGTMLSFCRSPGSARILKSLYVSGGFEETTCHLFAFDIG